MKRLTALISALLLVSGLCSCGEVDNSEEEETSAKTSVSEETETSETETTTISEDEEPEISDSENLSESEFVGKWEVVKIVMDGEDVTEMFAPDFPAYMYGQLEVKDKGRARMYTLNPSDERNEEVWTSYKWKMKDDKSAVFHESDLDYDMPVSIEDGFLVFSSDDTQLYFERVDEFHKSEDTEQNDDTEPTTVQNEDNVVTASDISDFVGKWECFDLGGIKENLDVVPSEFFKFEIKEDGSSTLYLNYGKENEYGETYTLIKKDDGTFEMDADYEIFPAEIENGILTVVIADTPLKFKKVEEFTVSES